MKPFDVLAIVLGGLSALAILVLFGFAAACFIVDHLPRRERLDPRVPRSGL